MKQKALSFLFVSFALILAISGCGKSVVSKGGAGASNPPQGADDAQKTATGTDTNTKTEPSPVPSPLPPVTGNPEAEKCDKERLLQKDLFQNDFMKKGALVQKANQVYRALDSVMLTKLNQSLTTLKDTTASVENKKAAQDKVIAVYSLAMKNAGMKVVAPAFGAIENLSSGMEQSYVGVYSPLAVMASVSREFTGDNELTVTKLNYAPGAKFYNISISLFAVKRGTALNDATGAPRQDITTKASFSGSLLRYIDEFKMSQSCKTLTLMTAEQIKSFNQIEAGK